MGVFICIELNTLLRVSVSSATIPSGSGRAVSG
jgi:hypothetical protein